ncbi:Anaphase-promoting complex subunit 8 [Elasticomyces elasticus]|nr:Anaphase-promoting complex subunit 8 [Elasticomyces elasticus]
MSTLNFNESVASVPPDEAEMLDALPDEDHYDTQVNGSQVPTSSYRLLTTSNEDPEEAVFEARETGKYLLAKSYFDTKEFDRCAAVFLPPAIPASGLAIFETGKPKGRPSTPSKKTRLWPSEFNELPRLSQKSLFLALYARYLAGEKRKEEESEMVLGPNDGGQSTNRELTALSKGLEDYFLRRDEVDPQIKRSQGWLEYLYGIVLARSKQEEAAQDWLVRSVRLNPYHWGAWEELSSLLSSIDDLDAQLNSNMLGQNVITLFYQVHTSIDLFSTSDLGTTMSALNSLLEIFPTSAFLSTLQALAYYHSKDFDTAASIFREILVNNPYRADSLEHYSNILYVMEDRPKLAFLAHLATSIDKFRPEACCIVGNYYSLCSQHEKAVLYFRRALTLDKNFLSAWTLMGHEYIELKNTHAAIESYRRAVDVNRKDYRAWYGLGQAYEMLDMGFYALFYYQRAAGLRPYDPKMWQAVGTCYSKMNRIEQAIKALKRALVASTYFETESPAQSFATSITSQKGKLQRRNTGRKMLDPGILFDIATLYERVEDEVETARYMELCVAQELGTTTVSPSRARKGKHSKPRLKKEKGKSAAAADTQDDSDDAMSNDTEPLSDASNDTEPLSAQDPSFPYNKSQKQEEQPDDGFGYGTTAMTSKARLWLAKYAMKKDDLDKAERLAEELCIDGYEVEEAKGLVREVRGKREAAAEVRGPNGTMENARERKAA